MGDVLVGKQLRTESNSGARGQLYMSTDDHKWH